MDEYPKDSVKQDPQTGYVAVRTMFEFDGDRAWHIPARGHYVALADVAAWTDMVPVTPPEPEP
jgi:hypothetical protein